MRIYVDHDLCEGNGSCVDLAPEAFAVDDDDRARVLVEEPSGPLVQRLRDAVLACPRRAIALEE